MAKRSSSSTPLWLITAILIIALAAGLYYLKEQSKIIHKKRAASVRATSSISSSTAESQKPQFDFYNVLPQSATTAPSKSTPKSTPPIAKPGNGVEAIKQPTSPPSNQVTSTKKVTTTLKQAPVADKYYLQIASVKNYADADSYKANLILQGYSVTVAKVTLGQEVRYRINVGPYDSLVKAQEVQKDLLSNKIKSILKKSK